MTEICPYSTGYAAYREGKSLLDNPFPRDKPGRAEWRAGWYRSQHDAKSLPPQSA